EDGPRQIRGYRRGRRGFVEIPLDARGRLPLKPFGLSLGLREERVVCYDAGSGDELGDYQQVVQAWHAADEARQAAEKQAGLAQKQARKAEKQAREAEQRIRDLEAELRRLRGEATEQCPLK